MKQQVQKSPFWVRVDETLKAVHMNLTSLANESGIGYRCITMQRHRSCLPSLVDAVAIARVLGVSVEYLVLGSQPEPECSITKFRKYADIEADLLTIEKVCPDRIALVRYFIDSILGHPEKEHPDEIKVFKFPERKKRYIGNE